MPLKPGVSAHAGRGEGGRATEESFRRACASGAEYVELDVRRLADGCLVCFHDERVSRTGPRLSTMDHRELCESVGYRVPLMKDVLADLAGRAMGHLDIKESGYEEQVVALASDILGESGYVVATPEDSSLRRIAARFPGVRTALSLGRDPSEIPLLRRPAYRLSELRPLRRVRSCAATWVAVDKTLARLGVLRQCAAHGIGAMVWTVNDDALIDHFLADRRVDVLVTDRPEYVVARRATLVAERGARFRGE